MTSALMEEWLREFDKRMGSERRKILLFLDNACSHPRDIQLRIIRVVFLTSNCTSVVQPLDQGIIKNFKMFYRTMLVKNLLSKIETVDSVQNLAKAINLLDAVYFINSAWQKVMRETVEHCFCKVGFMYGNDERTVMPDDFLAEDDLPLAVLAEMWRNTRVMGISSDDLGESFNIDANLIFEDTDDILHDDGGAQAEIMYVSDDDQELDEEFINAANTITNYQQTIGAVNDLKIFVQDRGVAKAVQLLSDLQLHFQDSLFKTKTRQTTLLDYFRVP